jgi:hypothetical protein
MQEEEKEEVARFSEGDRVSWKAGGGTAVGEVTRVVTRRALIRGRPVAGSAKDPRYVVRDERTGKDVVRKGGSLTALKKERRRPRLPSLKILGAAAALVLIAAGGVLYFTQMPGRAADSYREEAAPEFEEVDDSLYAAFQTFRAPFFRGLAIEEIQRKRLENAGIPKLRKLLAKQLKSDKAAIATATAAVDEAEKAIDAAEPDLTEVDAPPLLAGKGELADADDDADDSSTYVVHARAFVADYRELLAYATKAVAIDKDVTAALLGGAPKNPESATPAEFERALGATLVRLRKAKRKLAAAGKGGPNGSPFRTSVARGLDLTIQYYDKLRTAFDNLDLGLFNTANDEFDERTKTYGRKVASGFFWLQASGPLAQKIGVLEDREEELAARFDVVEGPRSVFRNPAPRPPAEERDRRRA